LALLIGSAYPIVKDARFETLKLYHRLVLINDDNASVLFYNGLAKFLC